MRKNNGFTYLRVIILAAGLCLLITGISRGEPYTVRDKAVRVCLECIGIG